MSVHPPRPSLPPLNALRAFEAAARLGGFKGAAAELNVTAGAVAQHIKLLEEICGAKLFERRAQGVRLTAVGRAVLPEFIAAFDAISRASQSLRAHSAPNRINLATLPGIAQLLLAEWLPEIRRRVPGLQLSVTAMEAPPNLAREPFDVTLFFGTDGELLFGPDVLLPICSPNVARRMTSMEAMLAEPHISDQFWPDDWPRWMADVHPGVTYTGRGPSHSLYAMAVAEAVAGAGILMGHLSLVHPMLDRGELVAAVPGRVEIEAGLVMGCNAESPAIVNSIAEVLRDLCSGIGR